MSSGSATPGRRHRPALIALVVVAATACLALAWWQWDRYESSSGTAQNLGYALQWPAFAVAVLWAYRRFVVLEGDPDEQRKAANEASGPTEIPAGILPDRPSTPSASSLTGASSADDDSSLAEYNSYLADLDRSDTSHKSSEEHLR
ncbi:transcriptional regulator [Gordonia sp. Z-3]|jgi:DNA-binding transcriptional regulator of glucitol operon|uniref:Transcriptional regulator n=1 Tax=Gordonia tangerina TaxID=2911060 RepID=A0ABS9DMT4_9ACTN|nr:MULTISPECIES: transcriptional regulator [Gordonia]MCF3940423.1 transcriptional regulator [Gordonia tangerina]MED5803692.1 transcriptional regulator [Gordonia sp. Z-3]